MTANGLLASLLPDSHRKLAVWLKGRPLPGRDPAVWREDDYGNAILFTAYGDRSSAYGWEIDHILAVSLGGIDHISNLRPLHWRASSFLGGVLGSGSNGLLG